MSVVLYVRLCQFARRLFVYLYACICVPVCLSPICLSISPFLYLPVLLPVVCLSILSICLPENTFIYLSVSLSISCPSSICQSICLHIHLSVHFTFEYLSIHISVCTLACLVCLIVVYMSIVCFRRLFVYISVLSITYLSVCPFVLRPFVYIFCRSLHLNVSLSDVYFSNYICLSTCLSIVYLSIFTCVSICRIVHRLFVYHSVGSLVCSFVQLSIV